MEHNIPNRKQRREYAKQLQLKKPRFGTTAYKEMQRRIQETGKEIHRINTEKVLRQVQVAEQNIEEKFVQSLIEQGYTHEESIKLLQQKNSD